MAHFIFHYFKEPSMGEDEDDEEEEEDEDGEPGKKSKFTLGIDEDYEIGHSIRTSIIPEAILWFTGEANEDEDYDFGEDDEDEEGDEDEDGDDDDDADGEPDEESEEVVRKPKSKKGWKGGAAKPGSTPQEQPECKQN